MYVYNMADCHSILSHTFVIKQEINTDVLGSRHSTTYLTSNFKSQKKEHEMG